MIYATGIQYTCIYSTYCIHLFVNGCSGFPAADGGGGAEAARGVGEEGGDHPDPHLLSGRAHHQSREHGEHLLCRLTAHRSVTMATDIIHFTCWYMYYVHVCLCVCDYII